MFIVKHIEIYDIFLHVYIGIKLMMLLISFITILILLFQGTKAVNHPWSSVCIPFFENNCQDLQSINHRVYATISIFVFKNIVGIIIAPKSAQMIKDHVQINVSFST